MARTSADAEQEHLLASVSSLTTRLESLISFGRPPNKLHEVLHSLRSLGPLTARVIVKTGVGLAVAKVAKDVSVDNHVRLEARELVEEWRHSHRERKEQKGISASATTLSTGAGCMPPSSQAKGVIAETPKQPVGSFRSFLTSDKCQSAPAAGRGEDTGARDGGRAGNRTLPPAVQPAPRTRPQAGTYQAELQFGPATPPSRHPTPPLTSPPPQAQPVKERHLERKEDGASMSMLSQSQQPPKLKAAESVFSVEARSATIAKPAAAVPSIAPATSAPLPASSTEQVASVVESRPPTADDVGIASEYLGGDRLFTAWLMSATSGRRLMGPRRKSRDLAAADAPLIAELAAHSPESDELVDKWRGGSCGDREVAQVAKQFAKGNAAPSSKDAQKRGTKREGSVMKRPAAAIKKRPAGR